MVSYSSSPPRRGGKHSDPSLRAKTAPCSLVIRRRRSRTPGKLLSGLSLMPFLEGSVCSPLCSTTRLSMAAGWAGCYKRYTNCYHASNRGLRRPLAVTSSYLLLHSVHKLLPGASFVVGDAVASYRTGVEVDSFSAASIRCLKSCKLAPPLMAWPLMKK
jgi:hypothetical protein